jgi:hypothetical protein
MIKGEVISYAAGRPLPPFTGWSVMFRYLCSCGSDHHTQAQNVWPNGDSNTDSIKIVCPVTNESNEIELTKPV